MASTEPQPTFPPTTLQLMVTRLSTNIRDATEVMTRSLPDLGPKDLLIKTRYVGVNASDINMTSGTGRLYLSTQPPPFPLGFEGLGEVIGTGSSEENSVPRGSFVVYRHIGSYAEYMVVPAKKVVAVPELRPEYLSFAMSAPTAALALEKEADLQPGKTVLVTAAAGGTGQFAVQIAKRAGCTVIGTCSTEEKAALLRRINCDLIINYKLENLGEVLSRHYPDGIDIIFESVGKEMFQIALQHLAPHGRLLAVGQLSAYVAHAEDLQERNLYGDQQELVLSLMSKCASLRGFYLHRYDDEILAQTARFCEMYSMSPPTIEVDVDTGERSSTGHFKGLDKIADALEYLYSGQNVGKVVVEIEPKPFSPIKMANPHLRPIQPEFHDQGFLPTC